MSDQTGNPPEEPIGGAWPPAAPPPGPGVPPGPGFAPGPPVPPGYGPVPGYGAGPGYAGPPAPGYAPPYGYGQPAPASDANDTMALVLGILGIVVCPLLAPVALFMGKKRVDDARARGLAESGMAKAGYILGVVGSVIVLVWVAFALLILLLALSTGSTR